jgi:streptomycin 6-kinase
MSAAAGLRAHHDVRSPAMEIHPGLEHLRETASGRAWLDRLPSIVERCVDRWNLRLGPRYGYASSSLVFRATRDDGTPVALKIEWPHREATHEADALRFWNGDGSVLLLEWDPEDFAFLLERCEPGSSLKDLAQDDALDVTADICRRLWRPAGEPFTTLADEAAWWADYLPRVWRLAPDPFERRLLDAAMEALEFLPRTQGKLVLTHQDLHADNVLRAERQPWLAIDPKPLLGEREFGIAAIVRGDELGRGPGDVRHRLDRLVADLGLDRERAKMWAFAQTLAWGVDEDENEVLWEHVEVARWILDA